MYFVMCNYFVHFIMYTVLPVKFDLAMLHKPKDRVHGPRSGREDKQQPKIMKCLVPLPNTDCEEAAPGGLQTPLTFCSVGFYPLHWNTHFR